MNIRSKALAWLASRRITGGHVVASKRYGPDESWTKEKAWWIHVPIRALRANELIFVLCEASPGSGSFRLLEVPSKFLLNRINDFKTIGGDKLNLFLAAEAGAEFEDQRGPGRVKLAQFERH